MQKIKLGKRNYTDKKKNLKTKIKLDSWTTAPNLIVVILRCQIKRITV